MPQTWPEPGRVDFVEGCAGMGATQNAEDCDHQTDEGGGDQGNQEDFKDSYASHGSYTSLIRRISPKQYARFHRRTRGPCLVMALTKQGKGGVSSKKTPAKD